MITVAGTRGGIDAIRKNAPCAPHALLTPSSRPHSPESQHISALLDDESELRGLVALLVTVAQAEGVPLREAGDAQSVVEEVDAEAVDRLVAQLPGGARAVEWPSWRRLARAAEAVATRSVAQALAWERRAAQIHHRSAHEEAQ